jgi:amidase
MLAESGAAVTAAEYIAARHERERLARRIVSAWRQQADVLLLPTLRERPPILGELAPLSAPPDELFARIGRQSALVSKINMTGEPAISLPLGWDSLAGLPIGIQLVAPYGEERMLFSLAGELEEAAPWAGRYPAQESDGARGDFG